MTDVPRPGSARQLQRAAREARRAEALRANLRRRKEQARAREETATSPPRRAPARDEPPT